MASIILEEMIDGYRHPVALRRRNSSSTGDPAVAADAIAHGHAMHTALVTGVGREEGLGLEICRQLAAAGSRVVLTARTRERAEAVAAALPSDLDVHPWPLDVTDDASVDAAAAMLRDRFGVLHALVNNASASFDPVTPSLEVTMAVARAALDSDALGPWRTIRAFAPLLVASGAGRVVNVSSGAGAFHGPGGLADLDAPFAGTLVAYAVAKCALHAVTAKLAAALRPQGVLVNAVSPGFVATHPELAAMGARPVAEGARGVVWAATLPAGGPTGGFFLDGARCDW
jgi:NAD(P)-dependent dehydrogenase (short-subunit alcohol dehydrogenase family)